MTESTTLAQRAVQIMTRHEGVYFLHAYSCDLKNPRELGFWEKSGARQDSSLVSCQEVTRAWASAVAQSQLTKARLSVPQHGYAALCTRRGDILVVAGYDQQAKVVKSLARLLSSMASKPCAT